MLIYFELYRRVRLIWLIQGSKPFHSHIISPPILPQQIVGVRIGRTSQVRFIQERLNAQQHLLQRHRRPPIALEQAEANRPAGEDVRVGDGRGKDAYPSLIIRFIHGAFSVQLGGCRG